MPTTIKREAYAYITHSDRLLLCTHPNAPEAGMQIPGGTIEDDESPEQAVLRESHEETGLAALELAAFLGEQTHDMSDFGRDEIHHRFFFRLHCTTTPRDTWRYHEPHPVGGGEHPLFQFFWTPVSGVPDIIADQGAFLPALRERLARL